MQTIQSVNKSNTSQFSLCSKHRLHRTTAENKKVTILKSVSYNYLYTFDKEHIKKGINKNFHNMPAFAGAVEAIF